MSHLKQKMELINDDCRNHVSRLTEHDNCLVIYDPPYDEWDHVLNITSTSKIAFTSPQRRHETENILGKPRNEIVWFFKDGRWVSKNYFVNMLTKIVLCVVLVKDTLKDGMKATEMVLFMTTVLNK
jgi:hypothetical protein